MSTTPLQFWNWFKEHHHDYLFLEEAEPEKKEQLLDRFLAELHQYSTNLFFAIGGNPDEPRDLIITAEGNLKYFDAAESLVAAAPRMDDWNFIAFKPGIGFDFKIEFKGLTFDPKNIWFLPMASASRPGDLGLRVGIHEFTESKEADLLAGIFLLLNEGLGEKEAATTIKYVEVCKLPEQPEQDGFIELAELPGYIAWWRNPEKDENESH